MCPLSTMAEPCRAGRSSSCAHPPSEVRFRPGHREFIPVPQADAVNTIETRQRQGMTRERWMERQRQFAFFIVNVELLALPAHTGGPKGHGHRLEPRKLRQRPLVVGIGIAKTFHRQSEGLTALFSAAVEPGYLGAERDGGAVKTQFRIDFIANQIPARRGSSRDRYEVNQHRALRLSVGAAFAP